MKRILGKTEIIADLALILSAILYGSSFIVMKIALAQLSPIATMSGRMIFAALIFLLFTNIFKKIKIQPEDWKWIILMGIYEPCLYFLFEGYALKYTTASQAGVITATLPILVTIATALVLKEKVSKKIIPGFALAITGTIILSFSGNATDSAPNPLLGDLLEFLAMVCATGGIVTTKYLCKRYNPFFLTALQVLAGFLFFVPYSLATGEIHKINDTTASIVSIAYLGIFVSLGAYSLYNFAISKISTIKASIYINLIPVFAMAFGSIFLYEQFTALQISSCVMIFAGVIVSSIL